MGNLPVVKTIIEKRHIHAGSCDEEALKQASCGGHLHVVKYLLSKWALLKQGTPVYRGRSNRGQLGMF